MAVTLSSTFKILVVDDEKLLQSLIEQKFKNSIKSGELEFSFASNGQEALEVLNHQPDIGIILLDLNMPVMNGFTLLDNLLQQIRICRVIVVTAYGDMTNIRRSMNGGASDFITKPIDLDDLARTIDRNRERYEDLKNADRAHKEYLELSKELMIAKKIQSSLIPPNYSVFPKKFSLDVFGEIISAKEMGGDFYDFFRLDKDHAGFFIGEVAGRGVPAALFMTITRTLLHTFALQRMPPRECFEKMNKLLLVKEIAFALFVTAFYGIIDLNTGLVRYCNAGHTPLLLTSPGKELKEMGRYEGIALAITDDPSTVEVKFQEKEFQLSPGETMILYTNGVLETQNPQCEMYLENRLKDFLKTHSNMDPEMLVKGLREDLQHFASGMDQMNDVTILALTFNGN